MLILCKYYVMNFKLQKTRSCKLKISAVKLQVK